MPHVAEYIRATMASGATYEDPSEDLLLMLCQDVESDAEQFFILERLADTSGQTYAQTIRSAESDPQGDGSEGWIVERREWAYDFVPYGETLPEHEWSKLNF